MSNLHSVAQRYFPNAFSVQSAPSIGPLPTGGINLSPESLLTYCTSRLRNLDSQVQEYFKKQNATTQAIDELSKMQRELGPLMKGDKMGGKEVCDAICLLDKKIAEMPEGAGKEKLKEIRDSLWTSGSKEGQDAFLSGVWNTPPRFIGYNTDNKPLYEEAKIIHFIDGGHTIPTDQLREAFRDANTALNKDAEMGMLHVQSLMSERQTALQLTTNLLNSLSEQLKTISQNVGR
ncbi:MAG: hypothetical protein KBF88_07950 [Polyangiaceae bacterium]|nr:hypothetical protein [Polyangiaceae bacterium]